MKVSDHHYMDSWKYNGAGDFLVSHQYFSFRVVLHPFTECVSESEIFEPEIHLWSQRWSFLTVSLLMEKQELESTTEAWEICNFLSNLEIKYSWNTRHTLHSTIESIQQVAETAVLTTAVCPWKLNKPWGKTSANSLNAFILRTDMKNYHAIPSTPVTHESYLFPNPWFINGLNCFSRALFIVPIKVFRQAYGKPPRKKDSALDTLFSLLHYKDDIIYSSVSTAKG